jgi:hypothetical protein
MAATAIIARIPFRLLDRDFGIAVRSARIQQIPLMNSMIFSWCAFKNAIVYPS